MIKGNVKCRIASYSFALSLKTKTARLMHYAFMLCILVFVNSITIAAENGTFEHIPLELSLTDQRESISLDGPWQVIRHKIVRPDEFDAQYNDETIMFPDRWHNQPNELAERNGWPSGFGVASYRKKLIITENNLPLSLKLQTPYSAYELWINGQLIASNGQIAERQEKSQAFYLERRVPLPLSGEVTINLIVSNFEHAAGGILRPPIIQPSEAMEQEARGYDLSYLFVLGALSSLLIFHLAYFFRGFRGGQDWSLFWYCMLVTIVIVRLATLNTILFRIFPDFPQFSDKFLVYLTLYSASTAYLTFLASIFPDEFPKYIKRITYWGSAPFILSVIFLPVHVYTSLQDTFIIFAVLILFYNQYAIVKAWWKKRSGAGAIVIFTALFLATAVNDGLHYLHAFNLRPSSFSDLMPFGFLLISIGHAIALSARSRKLYEKSLALTDNLQTFNATLDERVKARTKEAQAAQSAAEKSAREKVNFMSAASHDLRQPVQALSIFNQNLKKTVGSNTNLTTIAGKQEQLIGSLSDMLETMLEASQLEAKTINVSMNTTSVSTLFEELKNTLQPIAQQNNVDLRICHSSHHVRADAKYLKRVLGNLVANAIKASPGGHVLMGVKRHGENVKFIVADNGHGIPSDEIAHIFDRYVQLEISKKTRHGGLGLGLSIVRELCALMDMNIEVKSEPDMGTIFSVSVLTAIPSIPAVKENQDSKKEPQPTQQRLVILVVDDSKDACEALVHMFRDWGHAARGVSSLEAAIDTLDDLGQPDLIATDYYLGPQVTGLDVISNIRERFANTPAIIITGATAPNDLMVLKRSGFRYFHKPVAPDVIQHELQKLIPKTTKLMP